METPPTTGFHPTCVECLTDVPECCSLLPERKDDTSELLRFSARLVLSRFHQSIKVLLWGAKSGSPLLRRL
jgi:hypothetical protein